eukprot:gene9440-biopygen1245
MDLSMCSSEPEICAEPGLAESLLHPAGPAVSTPDPPEWAQVRLVRQFRPAQSAESAKPADPVRQVRQADGGGQAGGKAAASWRQMAAKRHGGKMAAKLGGKVRRGGKASRRQSGSKAWRHGGKASWRQSGGEENLARDRRHAAVEQPAAAPVAHRRRQVDPSPAQRVGELRHPPQQPRDRRAGDLHVEVDRVEGAGDRRPHDEGDAAVAGRDEARRRGDVPVRGARGGEGRRHLPAEVEAGDAPLHRRRPRRPRRDPPPVERRGAALGRRRGAPPFRRVVVRQVEVVLEQDVGDEALPEEAVVCREVHHRVGPQRRFVARQEARHFNDPDPYLRLVPGPEPRVGRLPAGRGADEVADLVERHVLRVPPLHEGGARRPPRRLLAPGPKGQEAAPAHSKASGPRSLGP